MTDTDFDEAAWIRRLGTALEDVACMTGRPESFSGGPMERVADGNFPQPIRLGARAVGWIESEVDAWIRDQIAASRSSAE